MPEKFFEHVGLRDFVLNPPGFLRVLALAEKKPGPRLDFPASDQRRNASKQLLIHGVRDEVDGAAQRPTRARSNGHARSQRISPKYCSRLAAEPYS